MKIDLPPLPPPVRGFRFSGVHGGLKKRGRRDFALIVADQPVVCAAVFTTNAAAAAPVIVAREHTKNHRIQIVMVNSGNANAATGKSGLAFAKWSCREVASRLGVSDDLVLPCSTGVIGVELDRQKFKQAVTRGVDGLGERGVEAAARAIMTSDEFPKWSHRVVEIGGSEVTVTGIAKGAGMIHPNMATMLAFVMTDACLPHRAVAAITRDAVAQSFNRVSVDGDTSTNDTFAFLASEKSGPKITGPSSPGYDVLRGAVNGVMDDLSRMLVRDGEGATKMVDIIVTGASSNDAATRMARAVGTSTLVKCAFTGADPNWGRMVMALGNSGESFDPEKVCIRIESIEIVNGDRIASPEDLRKACRIMKQDAYTVAIRVGGGEGEAMIVTSDLTKDYVHFNSAYTS